MNKTRKWAYSLLGFVIASLLTSALSIYVLFMPYFSEKIGVNIQELILWGNLAYFIGMPIGKIIGRFLKFYKRLTKSIIGLTGLISISIALMPFISSFSELIILRIIQGTVTFYMEIFSNVYSFLFSDFKSRNLASAISISGIPGGVAIGTSAYILETQSPILVYSIFSIISFIVGLIFAFSTLNFENTIKELKNEYKGTTYKLKITWIMGFYWATIAGFNLVLAILLQPFVSSYSVKDVPIAMETFGYSGAILTIAGGFIAYLTKSLKITSIVIGISYIISFIGFLILYLFEPVGIYLALTIILIMIEAIAVPFIYSIPREIYKENMVAKGTWEFAFIGSSFHIWGALIVLTIGSLISFRYSILALAFPPIYGALISFLIPRFSIKGDKID
ncbi:Major Facilitator Superfamily transporter [Caldisphaera lagunensis DSM 15908]|uniref:Major Facilitator Superfamily transporter n=1 Tax=Caldisphaera lagunensis (strain DSM 15908 / JCM 11604 / ANMR 0165 / IC-154) TaxID=1056495 RepID=L0AA72_CALLD|nr:MFS transporter [Caldisphaera lagunensis]AFZ69945.1 Major Facilitator Superfamily transporter [Caldisphaera lagunensis DSM 15908]